jgi:hypothetical protein
MACEEDAMHALAWVGRLLGIVGAIVCAVAGVARLSGHYSLHGFPAITLFEGGTTALVAGCFCLLWIIASRR